MDNSAQDNQNLQNTQSAGSNPPVPDVNAPSDPEPTFMNVAASPLPPPPASSVNPFPVIETPDLVMPPIPTTESVIEPSFVSTAPSGGSGTRVKIAGGLFGILVLAAAVGAGAYLVKQNQELREKAATAKQFCGASPCDTSQYCWVASTNNACRLANGSTEDSFEYFAGLDQFDGQICYTCPNDETIYPEDRGQVRCSPGQYVGGNSDLCQGASPPPDGTPPPDQPTPPPTHPPSIGLCRDVRIYDTSWNLLTAGQLTQLTAGQEVWLVVRGEAGGGPYDKARFKINGDPTGVVTDRRPDKPDNENQFAYLYSIPVGVADFVIKAEIHDHDTGEWL